MSHYRQHAANSGFTLIELLVVTAIIAILAAFLFPVFAQTREKARQTSCLSNLKQLGTALAMYTHDYDGLYPAAVFRTGDAPPLATEEEFVDWAEAAYPYIKNGAVSKNGRITFSSGIFHCPSDAGTEGPSYGINSWVLVGLHEDQVMLPADTVILAEKRGSIPRERFAWWIDPWPAWPLKEGTPIRDREAAINAIDEVDTGGKPGDPQGEEREPAGLQTLRHSGGANWLLADSHVKWAKLERIWGNATTTNQLWPTR